MPQISSMDNQYEMKVTIKPDGNDIVGLYLCSGEGRKVIVNHDAASGYLTVDRTHSTAEELPKFSRIAYAKVTGGNGASLSLNIFTDKSTIEIFAEDGTKVFTLLTYASQAQTGVELFSQRGKTTFDITAWQLRSIW